MNGGQRRFSTLILAEQLNGNLMGNIGNMLRAAQELKDPKVKCMKDDS